MDWIQVFFVGVLVGVICVGGLALGMRWLIKSRDERLPDSTQQKFALLGIAVLIGQFVCAGLILWAVPGLTEEPLALAAGLLSMNLVLPFFAGYWFRKSGSRARVEDLKPSPDADEVKNKADD